MVATSSLLTRKEAAESLRQSIRQTDKLIAAAEIPVVRIGRKVLIRQSAIDYFIEARESRVKSKVNRRGARA